jgi:TolB protein
MRRTFRAAACLTVLLLSLAAVPARAVLYIDINSAGGKALPIAVADFALLSGADPSLATALPKVISDDLALSGFFDVIRREAHLERITPSHFTGTPIQLDAWKTIGAEAVVVGKVEQKGDRLSCEIHLYDAALGTRIASKRYEGPAKRYHVMGHRFADEILRALTGQAGVFDTKVAFSARPAKGATGKEIYTVTLDGEELHRITENRSFNLFPRWSPDGSSIAFTSYRTGVPRIYVKNLERGREREVAAFGSSKTPGCFSPDGKYLYVSVSAGGNTDIYRVAVDGDGREKVVSGHGLDVSPSLSPDGGRMAFVSDRGGSPQVYVKDLAGKGGEIRISHAGSYSTSPSWSPAGDRIAFTSLSGGKYSLYSVRPDGSDQRLLVSADGDCLDPSWSADGRLLVYTFQKKEYSDLRIVSADGRTGKRLYTGLPAVGSPAWSPKR